MSRAKEAGVGEQKGTQGRLSGTISTWAQEKEGTKEGLSGTISTWAKEKEGTKEGLSGTISTWAEYYYYFAHRPLSYYDSMHLKLRFTMCHMYHNIISIPQYKCIC